MELMFPLSLLAVFYSFSRPVHIIGAADQEWYERLFLGLVATLIFGAIVYGLFITGWKPAQVLNIVIGICGLISPFYAGP